MGSSPVLSIAIACFGAPLFAQVGGQWTASEGGSGTVDGYAEILDGVTMAILRTHEGTGQRPDARFSFASREAVPTPAGGASAPSQSAPRSENSSAPIGLLG
jgi:hypothetical protein